MDDKKKSSMGEYWHALLEYVRRPKTIFDLRDRLKMLLLLLGLIILLQKVVEILTH